MAAALPYTDERRVGIGRALVLGPAYLLLDEPAAGMSEVECEELMHLILAIPATFGCGVLLIEHSMRVVMGGLRSYPCVEQRTKHSCRNTRGDTK